MTTQALEKSVQPLPSGAEQMLDSLKKPPYSKEAEQAVLGGLLLNNQRLIDVLEIVTADDFFMPAHQDIFAALVTLHERNQPFDAVTLVSFLEQAAKLDDVGNIDYISQLVDAIPASINILHYARVVKDRALLRRMIHFAANVSQRAYHPGEASVNSLIDQMEKEALAVAREGASQEKSFSHVKAISRDVVEHIHYLQQLDSPITGVPTYYKDFDEQTAGLQRGDLIIVAGRPSMGKTAFALNLAERVAVKAKQPVAIFSLEMPKESLVQRMIASFGRIDSKRLRTGSLVGEEWETFGYAVSQISETQLYIDDTPAITPLELRSKVRQMSKEAGEDLGLIVVDYLQLMRGSSPTDNRVNEISEISRSLKALAKEMNVPVVALSQLNRSLESRPNKRPIMSDLRESGAIEQDADLIVFLYRDEVYNKDSQEKGKAEVIIGKQRNGPIGVVPMTFLGMYTRFEDYVHYQPSDGDDASMGSPHFS